MKQTPRDDRTADLLASLRHVIVEMYAVGAMRPQAMYAWAGRLEKILADYEREQKR